MAPPRFPLSLAQHQYPSPYEMGYTIERGRALFWQLERRRSGRVER